MAEEFLTAGCGQRDLGASAVGGVREPVDVAARLQSIDDARGSRGRHPEVSGEFDRPVRGVDEQLERLQFGATEVGAAGEDGGDLVGELEQLALSGKGLGLPESAHIAGVGELRRGDDVHRRTRILAPLALLARFAHLTARHS